MWVLLIWFMLAVAVAFLADSRGRSGIGFLLLSVVFSPLLGLIVVLVMSDLKKEARKAEEQKQEHERQLESIRAIAGAGAGGQANAPVSLADELQKLAELRDKGVLSEVEFQEQKTAMFAHAKTGQG